MKKYFFKLRFIILLLIISTTCLLRCDDDAIAVNNDDKVICDNRADYSISNEIIIQIVDDDTWSNIYNPNNPDAKINEDRLFEAIENHFYEIITYLSDQGDQNGIDIIKNIFSGLDLSNYKTCDCGNPRIFLIPINTSIDVQAETKLSSLRKSDKKSKIRGDVNFTFNINPGIVSSTNKDNLPFQVINNGFDVSPPPNIIEFNGEGTPVIAVIDTGIDYDKLSGINLHQNLSVIANRNCNDEEWFEKFGLGWNFVDNNARHYAQEASETHGTLVVKTLVNELKELGFEDTNYSILPLKVFDSEGEGSYWDIICAMHYINYIQDSSDYNPIKIVNASFGANIYDKDPEHLEIMKSYIDSLNQTSIFVTSAGNCGEDTDSGSFRHYPSGYNSDNLFAVGGYIIDENKQTIKAPSSNFGTTSIDIPAPYSISLKIVDRNKQEDEITTSGTSISTPLVSAKLFEIITTQDMSPQATIDEFIKNHTRNQNNLNQFNFNAKYYESLQN